MNIALAVHNELIRQKKRLALAESCTGGKIASILAEIPDASYYLLGSIVAYSNKWKEHFLDVSPSILERHGAVSAETVGAMLLGLFAKTDADYAIAVSGILGPKGGTEEKPVGTVYIGIGKRGEKADIGRIEAPKERALGMQFTAEAALKALWRRLAQNQTSFS